MSGKQDNHEINAELASKDENSKADDNGADSEKQSLPVSDADEALKIIGNGEGAEVDADTNRRLLRKIGV